MGVHTLRTLLIGLHDSNPTVIQTLEKVIVSQMNIEEIIKHFSQDESGGNKLSSLKIAIKEILDKQYPISLFTINYFKQLLNEIEKYMQNNPEQDLNQNQQIDNQIQNNQNYLQNPEQNTYQYEEQNDNNYDADEEEQIQDGDEIEYNGEMYDEEEQNDENN